MKKLLSVFLAFILIFSVSSSLAFAAGNSIATATKINLNTTYSDGILGSQPKDVYKFTVSSGNLNIYVKSDSIQYFDVFIYDESNTKLWSRSLNKDSTTGLATLNENVYLSSGTYYFVVSQGWITYEGNYSFKLSGTSTSSISLSASPKTINISKGDSAIVTFSYSGSCSNGIKSIYEISDDSVVSESWGSWSSKSIPLTVTGLKKGSTTITLTLKDSITGAVLDTETVTVNVSDSGSGDGEGFGTGFFLLDIFYIIIGFIAMLFFGF